MMRRVAQKQVTSSRSAALATTSRTFIDPQDVLGQILLCSLATWWGAIIANNFMNIRKLGAYRFNFELDKKMPLDFPWARYIGGFFGFFWWFFVLGPSASVFITSQQARMWGTFTYGGPGSPLGPGPARIFRREEFDESNLE